MNRLSAITALRDGQAHSGLDALIESIGDWNDRWGSTMEPEERDHTAMILERLLDLQAHAVRSATTRGSVMSQRIAPRRPDFFAVASEIVTPFGRAA